MCFFSSPIILTLKKNVIKLRSNCSLNNNSNLYVPLKHNSSEMPKLSWLNLFRVFSDANFCRKFSWIGIKFFQYRIKYNLVTWANIWLINYFQLSPYFTCKETLIVCQVKLCNKISFVSLWISYRLVNYSPINKQPSSWIIRRNVIAERYLAR